MKMLLKSRMVRLGGAVLLAGFCALSGGGLARAQGKPPIKIGVLLELTGVYASSGQGVVSVHSLLLQRHVVVPLRSIIGAARGSVNRGIAGPRRAAGWAIGVQISPRSPIPSCGPPVARIEDAPALPAVRG